MKNKRKRKEKRRCKDRDRKKRKREYSKWEDMCTTRILRLFWLSFFSHFTEKEGEALEDSWFSKDLA